MKLYTANFTIILNKHITNTVIDCFEYRVLSYLLMLSDDDGICFPSYSTIERHSDRLVDMLFKLAVSIEKQNIIAGGEYNDCYESYIEEVAEENVKKDTGGCNKIRFFCFLFHLDKGKKIEYNIYKVATMQICLRWKYE